MAEPLVLASYMKDLFAAFEQRGRLAALAVRDPDLVREVEAASRVSWLPIALNLRMVEGVVASEGEQAGLALVAECLEDQFERPLWRDFIGGALRLLGRDPGSLGRWIPKAMQLIFRGCGSWSAERSGERALEVRVHALPPVLAEHRLWLASVAVGMTPVFGLCDTSGDCALASSDPAQGTACYRLSWKPLP